MRWTGIASFDLQKTNFVMLGFTNVVYEAVEHGKPSDVESRSLEVKS